MATPTTSLDTEATGREDIAANVALVQHFYDEIFTRGNIDAADGIVPERFVDHVPLSMPGQPTTGPDAVKWLATTFRTAMPDLHVSIDDMIAKGDKVVTRVTWEGTQSGPLLGADPTGKKLRFMGIDITRFVDGQMVEHWGQIDILGALAQLGYLPE